MHHRFQYNDKGTLIGSMNNKYENDIQQIAVMHNRLTSTLLFNNLYKHV